MLQFSFLLEKTVSHWVEVTIPAVRYVFLGIILLCAIIVTLTTLFQNNSNDEGAFLSGGATESYYAKNKSGTMAGKLKILTTVCSVVIAVLTVLYFVSNLIYAG